VAYATVAQLREYLVDLPQEASTDNLLEAILDRATDIVNAELGFAFAEYGYETTERDVWSGAGGRYLYLPAYQEGSLESVCSVSSRATDDESTTEITDYAEESRWRLFRASGWDAWTWYRVSAIWGYGPAPDAIVEVTLEVAVNIWRGRDAMQWSSTLGAEGGGAMPYRRALTWAQRAVIDQVRKQYPQEPIG